MGECDAVVTAELGDGGETLVAAEHGKDHEGEDGEHGVASPVPATWVGHVGQGFQQGEGGHQNLWLGRAPAPLY